TQDNLQNKVYHFYLKNVAGSDKWFKTDATDITPNVPFVQSNLTLVFDPGAGIPSIPLRSINNGTSPLVLFVVYPSGTGSGNHSYRLAKWNGTSWVNGGVEICTGGDTTPQYIGDAGHAYNSGEFCLNHNDFNEIFASRLISGGTFEISRW